MAVCWDCGKFLGCSLLPRRRCSSDYLTRVAGKKCLKRLSQHVLLLGTTRYKTRAGLGGPAEFIPPSVSSCFLPFSKRAFELLLFC